MDLSEAINRIGALAADASKNAAAGRIVVAADGGTYGLERDGEGGETFKQLVSQPAPELGAMAVRVHTLQAVVDYLRENRDTLDLKGIAVHVVGPEAVAIVGPLRRNRDREVFVTSSPAQGDGIGEFIGRAYAQDDFVLKVQTLFKPSDERAALLALVGNLTDEAVRVAIDDGVTQQVSTRAGTKAGTTAVKSPVMLVPLRSFPEIELAPVPFIVRVKTQTGAPSTVALHDASGGAWRVDAIQKIAAFIVAAAGKERGWGLIA